MGLFSPNSGVPTIIGSALLAACAPQQSPNSFTSNETMRAVAVQFGTVESVRGVEIRSGQTRLGRITGAVIGGAVGSTIGSSTAANVAGAAGGAAAGSALGGAVQGSGSTRGVEITLKLDSGEMVAVVQPGDPRDFRAGDRVRMTGDGENVRVTR